MPGVDGFKPMDAVPQMETGVAIPDVATDQIQGDEHKKLTGILSRLEGGAM